MVVTSTRAGAPNRDSTGESSYGRQWYVVKTKPRAERHAAYVLTARQLTVYLPLLKNRHHSEPLFPGYLFLKMNLDSDEYLRSRSAPGVSYIVSAEHIPAPEPESLVEEIRLRVHSENSLDPAATKFARGDPVVAEAGPFQGVEAIFDRSLTTQGCCQVLVRILGRLARVHVSAEHLLAKQRS